MVTLISPVDKEFFNTRKGKFGEARGDRQHYGIDFSTGQQCGHNIYAAAFGKVILAGLSPTYGNMIVIKHSDGSSTLYAHMAQPANYQIGEWVKQKDIIGYAGDTGSPGQMHLHFEVLGQHATDVMESSGKHLNVGTDGFIHTGIAGSIDRRDPNPFFSNNLHLFKHFIWKCYHCNCVQCQARKNHIYEYGFDAEAPLHPNCDCKTVSIETPQDDLPAIQEFAGILFNNYLRKGICDMRLREFDTRYRYMHGQYVQTT